MPHYTGTNLARAPLQRVATLALTLLLSACGVAPVRSQIELSPFNAACKESCFTPCSEESTPITADPDSAVEAAVEERGLREVCNNRRIDCTACIIRAREAKSIQ